MSSQKHKVVVVGGGVGGVKAASLLAKDSLYDVTLISKNKTFEHRTSVHRDKRGRSRRHISVPLQQIFERRKADLSLVRAKISTLDPTRKVVISDDGNEYLYDSLIVALEGDSRIPRNFDLNYTYSAYSASDMNQLRKVVLEQFENQEIQKNYCVVGAGEAGIEMAYEMQLFLDTLANKYQIDRDMYRVILLEKEKRIMPLGSPKASQRLERKLEKSRVSIIHSQEVVNLQNGILKFKNGKLLDAGIAILAAGTRANEFFAANDDKFLLDEYGFVRVTPILEAEGYNDIYIVGNSKAAEYRLDTNGKIYDAQYVVHLLHHKRYSKAIPDYDPPRYLPRIQLGHFWALYQQSGRTHTGVSGWARKRWLDRKHFSTLLPRRVFLSVWVLGSRHED